MPRTLIAFVVILAMFALIYWLLPPPVVHNCHRDKVPCVTALHPPRH